MEDRHRHAVTAYCREVCAADLLPAAAGAALRSAGEPQTDEELLRSIRQTARQFRRGPELAGDLARLLDEVREARATRAFRGALRRVEMAPAAAPAHAERPRGLVVFPSPGADAPASSRRPTPVRPYRERSRRTRARRPRTPLPALLSEYRVFLTTLALGAVLVVVVALAIPAGGSAGPAAASLPPPSPLATPPALVGAAAAPPHLAHRVRHRALHATVTTTRSTTTTSTPTTTTALTTTTTSAPATPAPSSTSSGSTHSSGQAVITQQGLPAQTAPTHTVTSSTTP